MIVANTVNTIAYWYCYSCCYWHHFQYFHFWNPIYPFQAYFSKLVVVPHQSAEYSERLSNKSLKRYNIAGLDKVKRDYLIGEYAVKREELRITIAEKRSSELENVPNNSNKVEKIIKQQPVQKFLSQHPKFRSSSICDRIREESVLQTLVLLEQKVGRDPVDAILSRLFTTEPEE